MSWVKRRGQANPNSAPTIPVQMYDPNQHPPQENQWQRPMNNWQNQVPQNNQGQFEYNQMPQQQMQYWQQNYNQTEAIYNQNSQYNQYNQDQSGFHQSTGYEQPNYSNMQYSQQTTAEQHAFNDPSKTDADTWNWGWGDEENKTNANVTQSNNLAESFTADKTWDWSVSDDTGAAANSQQQSTSNFKEEGLTKGEQLFPKVGSKHTQSMTKADSYVDHLSRQQLEVPQNQIARNVALDHLTAMGKRSKIENLTPQWSVESQMSQDSSDDLLHTSESDKSHVLSRSSTVSQSPISGHDANLDATVKLERHSPSDFDNNQQGGTFQENREIVSGREYQDIRVKSGSSLFKNPTPPLNKVKNEEFFPPPKNLTPPLQQSTDDTKNPYKRTAGSYHKAANQFRQSNNDSKQFYPVNLETLPDNSEQPDFPQHNQQIHRISPNKTPQPWLENAEIAPMNDRNQYLETGHLSNIDLHSTQACNQQPEVSDTLPPPGLRRMVLGQMEQAEAFASGQYDNDNTNDEPPPGLSRMVLGQTENTPSTNLNVSQETESLVGLHRMIPGESSSPETIRQQNYAMNYTSETELTQLTSHITPQPRSATIGADTPPNANLNRSEAIGSDTSQADTNQTVGASTESRIRADGLDNQTRETPVTSETNRRESIDGQPEENEINNLVSGVRDLTVGGENPTDATPSDVVEVPRRTSRQESTDSERDVRESSPRDRRDHRYFEREEKGKGRSRDRYSPDDYRDKKYDRRRYREKKYEDDTDYYSEKERERRNREEYERKYSSLRREKDKDRRRKDHRDYGRDGRRDYYDRYAEDYENDSRSRPSSRSDSMHENYRERGYERDHHHRRHRERDSHRRYRDHQGYMQMYGYDPYNQYYQQYQYYENLRRTNPQAYAEWYRKYYQQAAGQNAAYGTEDRASVHSGRSSANDELAKDRYTRQSYYSQASLPHMGGYYRDTHSVSGQYGLDVSSYSRPFDQTDSSLNLDETVASQRLTPAKFATAHIKASISSGKLVKIPPHYPMDGQIASVELGNIQSMLQNDDEYKELLQFPGPLIKGVTHKKRIIEYCEGKIRKASPSVTVDCQSYILMWELLILLIRQNGMVVGADIAELLMKQRPTQNRRPSSVLSSVSVSSDANETSENNNAQNSVNDSSTSVLKEEIVTNKFREYLIHGSEKEALEWAMNHGLWGHALFLASKLDKRTYANVMMRFANGLTMNDPLQTLYQLLSGRLPAAVTCVADEKWGDWKPHLAMILSNTTQHPELDRKAITTLGDTLFLRGSLYAAQFCYLMAQVEFGRYGNPDSKLVLLGSNHTRSFRQFATCDSIHMTEIYEYACSLNDGNFVISEFQPYKYLIATRLADRGLLEKALSYLERLAIVIVQNPTAYRSSLINNACTLGDRLKYYDLVDDPDETLNYGNESLSSRPDKTWLKDLRTIQSDYNMGLIGHISHQASDNSAEAELQQQNVYEQINNQDSFQQYGNQQFQQGQWQSEQTIDQHQLSVSQQGQLQNGYVPPTQYQESQQQYWGNQQAWVPNSNSGTVDEYGQQSEQQPLQTDFWNNAQNEPVEVEKTPSEDAPRPQISMPNQSRSSRFDDDSESMEKTKKESPAKPKATPPKLEKAATTGWFGGIWSKLALRPKNQMKLPDDKNPTIVWDSEKKRWINLEDQGSETNNEVKPPPKMSELLQKAPSASTGQNAVTQPPAGQATQDFRGYRTQPSPAPSPVAPITNQNPPHAGVSENAGLPPKPTQPNMFKMQRNRNLKKSYVDVFNPGGKPSGPSSLPALDTFGAMPQSGTQMNFFVPQPVTNADAPTDFLTPAPVYNDDQQLGLYAPRKKNRRSDLLNGECCDKKDKLLMEVNAISETGTNYQ